MASESLTTTTAPVEAKNDTRVYIADADYLLPVDAQETDRLSLQHLTFKHAFDNRVLIAPVDKNASLFVLDSGTGNGIWLLDVARELPPSSILHGIDIEGNRFTAKGVPRPPNLSFSLTSILSIPPSWENRFDLIHQRLLVCGLKRSDWPTAVRNMHTALRPGGWVQLGEYNNVWGTGPCALRQQAVYAAVAEHGGLDMQINHSLPGLLTEAGFVDVKVERGAISLGAWAGERGKNAALHVGGFFRALKPRVLEAGGLGFGETDADLEEIIVGLEKEWDETEGTTIEFHIICARKP